MFRIIFQGDDFSYFYDRETEQYMLYWVKYDIDIILKDEDAQIFSRQIAMINSEHEKDAKARIERTIAVYFYFKYAFPMPQFVEK